MRKASARSWYPVSHMSHKCGSCYFPSDVFSRVSTWNNHGHKCGSCCFHDSTTSRPDCCRGSASITIRTARNVPLIVLTLYSNTQVSPQNLSLRNIGNACLPERPLPINVSNSAHISISGAVGLWQLHLSHSTRVHKTYFKISPPERFIASMRRHLVLDIFVSMRR